MNPTLSCLYLASPQMHRAELHVCSHICWCVNLTDVVFKGCDRRSSRSLARLSKPVSGYCCGRSIRNKLRKKVKQGRGVCGTGHSLLSAEAWPDESRLNIFLSLKCISGSRVEADTRFRCPRPRSYCCSPTQGCRNRGIHMLCEQTLTTSEYSKRCSKRARWFIVSNWFC